MKNLIYKRRLLQCSLVFVAFILACNVSSVNSATGNIETAAPANGIKFIEDDWNQALAQAKAQHKLVFLDIYATWCGPCKMLKKSTFADKKAGEFFNSNFINISVDGEKGVGPQLASQYSLEGYPTLIIADENGKAVSYTVGYIPAEKLVEFGKDGLKRGK